MDHCQWLQANETLANLYGSKTACFGTHGASEALGDPVPEMSDTIQP